MAAPGRPLKPLPADAPGAAAKLGAELRRLRLQHRLTLGQLGGRAGYSPQHISNLELASTGASRSFVGALDTALDAQGALLELLPAVVAERLAAADARAAARRYDEDDVEPTNRRGLIGGAAGAALTAAALGPAPAAAREVDPQLPDHWAALLALLGRQDALYGPHAVLGVVKRELRLIAEHRAVARGRLRHDLLGTEARWTIHAAWLCEDSGDQHGREELLERGLRLAREADDPDVMAWARARQAQWSDAPQAIRLADAGLRTPRSGAHTRALVAVRGAHAHAVLGDEANAEQLLARAQTLLARDSPPPPDTTLPATDRLVRLWEARCWSALRPARGVQLYERVLRDWPHDWARDGGYYQARLAIACAGAGELDRARAEGRKVLSIARRTKSATTTRELKRLSAALSTA